MNHWTRWIALSMGGFFLTSCQGLMQKHQMTDLSSAESLQSKPLPPSFKRFVVYSDLEPRHTHYVPSGYMGDNDLTMSGAYIPTDHGQGPCLRVIYKAAGRKGWSGIYWQDPANNWGDVPGRAGYDLRGATKVLFHARGENGGEKIHEFRMGGIVGQYPDSDVSAIGPIRLSKEWQPYSIELKGKDLRHIIGGFGFFVNKQENPGGIVFYLDDIIYQGPEVAPSTTTVAEMPPTTPMLNPSERLIPIKTSEKPAELMMEPPPPSVSTKDLTIRQTQEGLRVSFSSQFLFAPGRATLSPGSAKILDQLTAVLNSYPDNPVLIEGHTDNTGNSRFNLDLSRLRAESVRDYLVIKGGYEMNRFKVVGYGDTRPVAENSTKTGRSLNRRVEITILKTPKP